MLSTVDLTSQLLDNAMTLDPCLLAQNPVQWEFNPNYTSPVSFR